MGPAILADHMTQASGGFFEEGVFSQGDLPGDFPAESRGTTSANVNA